MIVWHPKRNDLLVPGSSSAYSANLEQRQRWTGSASDCGGVPMSKKPRSLAPASASATDLPDYSG